jgi:hypothetical protein
MGKCGYKVGYRLQQDTKMSLFLCKENQSLFILRTKRNPYLTIPLQSYWILSHVKSEVEKQC